MPIMSVNAYAKHRGVYHQAVREAIQRGTISKRADGKIDSEVADREWAANAHPVSSAAAIGGGANYAAFRTARAAQDAKWAQIKVAEKLGGLIDKKLADARTEALASEYRSAALAIPAREAAALAAELGVATKAARRALEAIIRRHLVELSGEDRKAA
jgi:hypothetical protein